MEEAQINIRCSKVVAERLKAITKAERIKSGDLLEKLLDCYQDSIKILSTDTGIAETGIAETVKALESRVMALEKRLETIGAAGKGIYAPADKMPVVADLTASVVVQSVEAETVEPVAIEKPDNASGFNQDIAAFKSAVVECWNGGMRGYGPIATTLEKSGYRNSRGNAYSRSDVKNALVKAGLVEV